MFLFLFFLFHDLNLELGMPLLLFWLENHAVLVMFVFVTPVLQSKSMTTMH
jgi:hypothetical protein